MAAPTRQLTRAEPKQTLVVPPLTASALPLRLSLVIPTCNEVESLGNLIVQLDGLLSLALPRQYEIIVVDDDSQDGTWPLAVKLAQQYPAVKPLHRKTERGLATAVIRGWQQARGEYLAVMDGDLQHPPMVLLGLVEALEQGARLAVASRYGAEGKTSSQWRGLRRSLSRSAQLLGWLMLPKLFTQLSDPLSGCFALRREVIAGRSLHPIGYKILLEVLARSRRDVLSADSLVEVGYRFNPRQSGHSKVTAQHYWQYIAHLLRLRWALWNQRLV